MYILHKKNKIWIYILKKNGINAVLDCESVHLSTGSQNSNYSAGK